MYAISIIIPMYNAEKYIKDAIESVCKQTIGFEKIQLILVDDASEDATTYIAKQYVEKYTNIEYMRLERKSGSAGKPRNEGFKLATGKYTMYMDADDMLEVDACEVLYNTIEEQGAQCVIANYRNMDEDGTKWEEAVVDKKKYDCFEVNMEDYAKSFFILDSAVWNKIYVTSFIREKNIKFLEGITAEDAFFCIRSFLEAEKIYYCNHVVYCYRMRNKTNLSVSNECNLVYFKRYNQGYLQIYNQFARYNNKEFFRFFFTKAILFMIYKFVDSTLLSLEERKEVLKLMEWFFSLPKEKAVIITEESINAILSKIQEHNYEQAIFLCDFLAKVRKDLPKEINAKMEQQDDVKYIKAICKENK